MLKNSQYWFEYYPDYNVIIWPFCKKYIYLFIFFQNFSVHEAAHGYNEAVEDYNRAQHNSSSSPSRGYSDHANHATSPGNK